MFRTLVTLALRHYRDPLSWGGAIVFVGTAAHLTIPPEYYPYIESIMASLVGIILLKADGRKNPNTDATGAVSARDPTAVVVVQGQPSAASGVGGSGAGGSGAGGGGGAGGGVSSFDRPNVSSAETGVRPGFGSHRA